jgi:hypothetical protein
MIKLTVRMDRHAEQGAAAHVWIALANVDLNFF